MVNIGDINFGFWDHLAHEAGDLILLLVMALIVGAITTFVMRRGGVISPKGAIWGGLFVFLIFVVSLSPLTLLEADNTMRKEAVQERVQSYYNLDSPFSTWDAGIVLDDPDEYIVIRENVFSDDADGLRKYDIAARYDSEAETVTLYVPVEEGKQEYTELEAAGD